jgi:hypothetical protein
LNPTFVTKVTGRSLLEKYTFCQKYLVKIGNFGIFGKIGQHLANSLEHLPKFSDLALRPVQSSVQ